MSRKLTSYLTLLVAISVAGGPVNAAEKNTIVNTAVKAGSFKTLAAALKAADLVGALEGKGPFTVFAPTDEAFARLPKGIGATLLKPENKKQLQAVLAYHVVPGAVSSKQVVSLSGAKTLNGQRLGIAVKDGKVMIDKATVIKADIECTNGVIHVIDEVVFPSSKSLVETAVSAGSFKTLLAAIKAAGLEGAVSGSQPLTVLAPTDEAFAKLPKKVVQDLLKPENKSKLAAILKYHVVPGRVFSEDALAAKKAKTLQGQSVEFSVVKGQMMVGKAKVIAANINAANGVIHVIDSVILPSSKNKVSKHDVRKMIEVSVHRGVALYNNGHHAACASEYSNTMKKMLTYEQQMPVLRSMRHALTQASRTSCATTRAWTLRRSLDSVYAQMRR